MKLTLLARTGSANAAVIIVSVFLFICSLTNSNLHAQKYYTAEVSYGLKLGETRPLTSSYIPGTNRDKLKELKKNKPEFVPNFFGRRQLTVHNPDALPKGRDPLWNPDHLRLPENEILPIVNVEGINEAQGSGSPPDVNGDIGKDFYVEIVNSTFFRVFDKTGQPVSGMIAANSIWTQVGMSSAGDPIILYDQQTDRWILTEFAPVNARRVLIAISKTSDPRGSWTGYSFQTPRFPDFPKYGLWSDALILSTNEGGANFPIYAFNRADLLAEEDTVRMQRMTVPKIGGVSFEVGQPVDWDGLTPPPAGSPGLVVKLNDDDWNTTTFDKVLLHKVNIDWENADSSNLEILEIATTAFDTDGCQLESTGGFSCIPQPNNQGIDGAEWIITNKAQYRNFNTHESFVMSFMVDVNGQDVAGIRWMEFRRTATEDWHLFQEGTVGSEDGLHRFMSSIGIDGQGNIGLAYSVSGFTKHPSLRYTGRYATDPLGTMTFTEYEFASGNGSLGFDRFGDYASMSVDPTDDATFWFAGEYIKSGGDYATRIVAFNAARDTFDLLPLTLDAPLNSAELSDQELLTITILNRGLETVYDFNLAFQFDSGAWISEPALIDSLPVDSTYTHTFATTLPFVSPGIYSLSIATGLDNDGNKLNDTLSFTVVKYAFKNAAIEYVPSGLEGIVCSSNTTGTIKIHNAGVDTLTSIIFQLTVNNELVNEITWNGSLAFGEETLFEFPIAPFVDGVNTFRLTASLINGEDDELPEDNTIEYEVHANPTGHHLTLHFLTDNFPAETSWELKDEDGNVLASAAGLTEQQHTYVHEFCLSSDACYTFTVSDVFGDGMSSQGVTGDYEILNDTGEVIAELPRPNFGLQSITEFCLTGECMLQIEAGVTPESAPGKGDGVAIVEPLNGLGTILYSVDGGQPQQSNIFHNLSAGTHILVAEDGANCSDTIAFEIISCQLQAAITTIPAVGGDVGEIHIDVEGALGEVVYSLNGGAFVQDSFFIQLEPGNYIVTVQDSAGCIIHDTVTVSTQVSTLEFGDRAFILISPNPGNGTYEVRAGLPTKELYIPFTIVSSTGEPLFYDHLVRYDDFYRFELSLEAYPAGTYYLFVDMGDYRLARKIINLE